MHAAGHTAIGQVRSHNEDAFFLITAPIGPLPNLFIVADGMGGHNAGEVASAKSVEYCCGFLRGIPPAAGLQPQDILGFLVEATVAANKAVFEDAEANPEYYGMGTTFSACSIVGGTLAIAHVGDSRIYAISPGTITRLTTDHTYVEEMVQAGTITADEAKTHPRRNIITRVLGCDPLVEPEGALHSLEGIRHLVLCSDGLTDMLSDEAIMNLASKGTSADNRAQALINAANSQGGIDNISAIIIDI